MLTHASRQLPAWLIFDVGQDMSLVENLRKLSMKEVCMLLFFSAAVMGGGIGWVWTFRPDIVDRESTAKLVVLATGVSLPFTATLMLLHAYLFNWPVKGRATHDFYEVVIGGSLVSVMASSASLAVAILCDLTFRQAFLGCLLASVGLLLVAKIAERMTRES